jgi:hypothetical protein
MVDWYACPMVLGTTLLIGGVVGTIQIGIIGGKLDKHFVQAMSIYIKALPTVLGLRRKSPEGDVHTNDVHPRPQ